MIAVEITEEVDTLGGSLPRGHLLFVAGEGDDVANLVDARGVQRVSCCPRAKFRYVSEIPDHLYDYFDGVRSGQFVSHEGTKARREADVSGPSRSGSWGLEDNAVALRDSQGGARLGVVREVGVACSPRTCPQREEHFTRRAAATTVDQVNAELAGLRSRASVESCPFDELPAAPLPLRDSATSREAPQTLAEIEYTTPDRLAWANAKRFPYRASEHPRRGAWGPEWTIAEYGISCGDQVIYSADCSDPLHRDKSGQDWRHFVDIDRARWKGWSTAWRPLEFTTEARRHGEEQCLTIAMRIETQTSGSINGSVPTASETEKTTQTRSTPLGDVSVVAAPAGSNVPSVPLCLRGEPSPRRICEPDEYPEPGEWMSPDERRGWRHVRSGREVALRYGVDRAEELPRFKAWCQRLGEYFLIGGA